MPVGELLLSAFLQVLFERLMSPELLKFATKESVRPKLKKWEKTLKMIEALLIDAEEKQLTDRAVKMWLDDLQDLAFDVEDVLDKFGTEALARRWKMEHRSSSKVWKLLPPRLTAMTLSTLKFNVSMGSKIDDITGRLKELSQRAEVLRLKEIAGGTSTDSWRRPPTTCLPTEPAVYGRDEDKAKVLEMVLSDEPTSDDVGVVTIVGMGGIGKTTLAREVYNDKAVESFELKAWVCVSDDFDVVRISNAILGSITLSSCDHADLNTVHIKLSKAVAGKKFLLVLDDIWCKDYSLWEVLKSPFASGAPGSKIIVTTRLEDVALTVGRPTDCYKLRLLSDSDCWSLFKKHVDASGVIGAHPHIDSVRQKVAEKCQGLPLAVKTLAGLLRSKQRVDEWMDILISNVWDLPIEGNILPILKLSYYHLPSRLKRCFAYCAIFPKGFEFEVKELIFLWMAEGLVHQTENNKQLEDLGGEYFYDLLSRSFFQTSSNDNSKYIMHDLVNDLAQVIAGNISFRLEDELGSKKQSRVFERTRYSSYKCSMYNCRSKFEVFNNIEHLRTFLQMPTNHKVITSDGYYLSNMVLSDLLMKFKKLRVLSLKNYHIFELPNSIEVLRHLRYLDLSGSHIRNLSKSISSMYNLQTLILRNCRRLLKLPSNMGNLVNLRHLDILGVALISEMPLGMRKLINLRTLSNFIVGKCSGSSLQDLKQLQSLCGELRISRLQNVTEFQDIRESILSNKEELELLLLEWGSGFDDSRDEEVEYSVLEVLRPHTSLKELKIACYGGTEFPSWIGDPSFCKMTSLSLKGCKNCKSLPPLGLMRSLKNLTLSKMRGLKSIGSEIYGDGCSNPFHSLQTLSFEDLEEWERWDPVESFPSLLELSIVNCPKLSDRVPSFLPSLEKLVIRDCTQLMVSLSSLPMLCELHISVCKKLVFSAPTGSNSLNSVTLSNISDFGNSLKQEFQKVECLKIQGCEELIDLWLNKICVGKAPQDLHRLTSLRELYIGLCDDLAFLPEGIQESNARLEELTIEDCRSLTCVFRGPLPPTLKRLTITNCEKLQSVFNVNEDSCTSSSSSSVMHKQNVNIIQSVLQYLFVEECSSLTCISPAPTEHLPASLSCLTIQRCSKLTTLFPRGLLPPTLKSIQVDDCSNLTTLSSRGQLPEMLEYIGIYRCPTLESVAEKFHNNKSLYSLVICECENLKSIPEGLHNVCSLNNILIQTCPSLEYFPERGLPNQICRLMIGECKKLKALPSRMHTLTSLRELSLGHCPSMSFPEEGLPTNLVHLTIKDTNFFKSLSNWGLHKLTSLRYLQIDGCLDAVSFPPEEMGMMLPTTLTFLRIKNFPNLRFLSSKCFQNLTSLKQLWIQDCPKLSSLPSLPSSLWQLDILYCPLPTKEFKRDKGKEWFKIADIPSVMINGQSIHDSSEGPDYGVWNVISVQVD